MTKTYYDKISKGYDRLHGEEQRNKLKIIKENLQKNKIKINKNTKQNIDTLAIPDAGFSQVEVHIDISNFGLIVAVTGTSDGHQGRSKQGK